MRHFIAALFAAFLAYSPAHAQTGSAKTPAALATETNAFWPDNAQGQITPFNARQTLLDIISSYPSITGGAGVNLNILNIQTANYQVAPSDCGKTIQAGTGSTGFFTVTFPSVAGFPTNCSVIVTDGDTGRGKQVAGAACSSRQLIWPGQTCGVAIVSGAWAVLSRPGRYRPPSNSTINFFTDFTNGTDVLGATDGLASGAQAFRSAESCFLNAADQIDFNGVNQTQILCNMAANTTDTQGIHASVHALVGAQGGAAFQIVGASLAVSGAISNAGSCEITVSSTATYSANQIVSVYGINGATGCNGIWKVTVTDTTHLTLQNATFGGAYTSGGTVTNGSGFNTTGVDGLAFYFGTVVQLENLTIASNLNGLDMLWGSKAYILDGNIFAGSPAGAHIVTNGNTQIEVDACYGISTGAPFHIDATMGGNFATGATACLNFLPGINHVFSAAFALSASGGRLNFNNITINTNSNTITGKRCQVDGSGSLIVSGTGNANTYFPGNSNCTQSGGASIDNAISVSTVNGTLAVANGGTGQASIAGILSALTPSRYAGGTAVGVNFNSANTDNAITIQLPTGVTAYQIVTLKIGNASASLSTSTWGLFSSTGGGGTTIFAAAQANTITTAAANTNNNSMLVTPANSATLAYNFATLQFRVGTAQGSPATGDVIIEIAPIY